MRTFTLVFAALIAAGAAAVACGSSSDNNGTTACVSGDQKSCACPGGGMGAQVCKADGSGYGLCMGCSVVDSGAQDATTVPDAPLADAPFNDAPVIDAPLLDAPTDGASCNASCSADGTAVVDCHGKTMQACGSGQTCLESTASCMSACQAAANAKGSVGCDFYAPHPETDSPAQCFAAYVVNGSKVPAHVSVEFYAGTPLDPTTFAVIPSGTGASITYKPYSSAAGIAPGQAAVLFLAGDGNGGANDPCPVTRTAVPTGSALSGTGSAGQAFHITTDVPVSVYQMAPYGGGAAYIPGASLLLPTSAWDTNYVVATAAPYSSVTMDNPSLNIIAHQDNTHVTMLPTTAVVGGGGLPAGAANVQYTLTLNKGQQAQFSQHADLTGTVIQSDQPIALLGANACMQEPAGTSFCDHGEQMLPPVKALGSEYAAVMFRPRVTGDQAIWRLVGIVNGTQLTYSTSVGGPATLNLGQAVEFMTDQPFTVQSQDSAHPFLLFGLMTGSQWSGLSDMSGYGDPDFVVGVPSAQFVTSYTFMTDETFPETNLVVVRAPDSAMTFHDVTLDCAGALTGWQAVGTYQWTRIDLTRHDFQNQGSCSSGPHNMTSTGSFGVWVWGWGSPETTINTKNVSYGYPAGMSAAPINSVVVAPTPH
jgi:hypothetical protein